MNKQTICGIALIFYIFIIVTGCSTMQAAKDSRLSPANAEEGVIVAYGALHAIEQAVAYTFSDPVNLDGNTNKAITALIADKFAAVQVKAINMALIDFRANHDRTKAIAIYGASPLDGYKPKTEPELYAKIAKQLQEIHDAADKLNAASDLATMDIAQCQLVVNGMPPMPCDVPTDYVLMVLLKVREVKQ